jgi:hypothetical protein
VPFGGTTAGDALATIAGRRAVLDRAAAAPRVIEVHADDLVTGDPLVPRSVAAARTGLDARALGRLDGVQWERVSGVRETVARVDVLDAHAPAGTFDDLRSPMGYLRTDAARAAALLDDGEELPTALVREAGTGAVSRLVPLGALGRLEDDAARAAEADSTTHRRIPAPVTLGVLTSVGGFVGVRSLLARHGKEDR